MNWNDRVHIDEIAMCIWKDLQRTPDSTTFESIREMPDYKKKKHPLYRCFGCGGYDSKCDGYASLDEVWDKLREGEIDGIGKGLCGYNGSRV